MRFPFSIWLGLLAAAGCGDDLVLEGAFHQYAVGDLRLPVNNQSARDNALDLNRDGTVDNQLGMVFGTLETMGYLVGDTAHEALVRGKAIMLAEVQTTSFDGSELSGVQTFLGASPIPAACLDPEDLSTCGQHLATRAHYDLQPDGASTTAFGVFENGRLLAPLGTLPVELSIDDTGPIRVDLRDARIKLTNMSEDGGSAILSGGILVEDVDGIVIPAATRQLARIATTECGQPTSTRRCGCPGGSRGLQLVELFDVDQDCTIELQEVRENSLVQSLLYPDLQLGGDLLLSFGFGVDFVPAEFTSPAQLAP